MVEKFTGFKASNGRAFDDERSAWKEELYILLHPLADNDAIARKLTDKIADAPHDIQQVLARITALSPIAQDPVPVGTTMEAKPGEAVYYDPSAPAIIGQYAGGTQSVKIEGKTFDSRPPNCRHRLKDEHKPYPRSGCQGCGATAFTLVTPCPRGSIA